MDHKGCQVSDAVDTKSFELAEDVWLIELCSRLGRERVVRALKQVEEGFIHDRSHLQTRERGTQQDTQKTSTRVWRAVSAMLRLIFRCRRTESMPVPEEAEKPPKTAKSLPKPNEKRANTVT